MVLLPPAASFCQPSVPWPAWLGEEPVDEAPLKALLAPYPSKLKEVYWPVSARVGNVKNNDPSLVEPINLP